MECLAFVEVPPTNDTFIPTRWGRIWFGETSSMCWKGTTVIPKCRWPIQRIQWLPHQTSWIDQVDVPVCIDVSVFYIPLIHQEDIRQPAMYIYFLNVGSISLLIWFQCGVSYECFVIHCVLTVWLETTLRIWWGHWRMVYLMWIVMGLLRAKQRAPKTPQGAARGEEEEEKQLFELAYLAEWLMTIVGLVNIVPMQMLGLPPHARCAINSGDETWILH